MECLKKLSLISLQFEVSDPPVLHLEQNQVLQLMCTKDFPFALTVAVAYDMDIESNWAEAIYEQSIKKKGEDFLQAFDGNCFALVYHFTTAVIALARITFCIFISQAGTHSLHYLVTYKVFRCNQLDAFQLALMFFFDNIEYQIVSFHFFIFL